MQVVDATLFLLHNKNLCPLIYKNHKKVFPLLIPGY